MASRPDSPRSNEDNLYKIAHWTRPSTGSFIKMGCFASPDTMAFAQPFPSRAKIVLLELANHADDASGYCYLELRAA
jgi:hypothetical protein